MRGGAPAAEMSCAAGRRDDDESEDMRLKCILVDYMLRPPSSARPLTFRYKHGGHPKKKFC
jgi:hypothetical protein